MILTNFKFLTSLVDPTAKRLKENTRLENDYALKLDSFFLSYNLDNLNQKIFDLNAVPHLDAWLALNPKNASHYIMNRFNNLNSSKDNAMLDLLVDYLYKKEQRGDTIQGAKEALNKMMSSNDIFQKTLVEREGFSDTQKIMLLASAAQRGNVDMMVYFCTIFYNSYKENPSNSLPLLAFLLTYTNRFIDLSPQDKEFGKIYTMFSSLMPLKTPMDISGFNLAQEEMQCLQILAEALNTNAPNLLQGNPLDITLLFSKDYQKAFNARLEVAWLYSLMKQDFKSFTKNYLMKPDFEEKLNSLFPVPEGQKINRGKHVFYNALLAKAYSDFEPNVMSKTLNLVPPGRAIACLSTNTDLFRISSGSSPELIKFFGMRGQSDEFIKAHYPLLNANSLETMREIFSKRIELHSVLTNDINQNENLEYFIRHFNLRPDEIDDIVHQIISMRASDLYTIVKDLPVTHYPHELINRLLTLENSFNTSTPRAMEILKDVLARENKPEFYLISYEKELLPLNEELIEYLTILKTKKELTKTLNDIEDFKKSMLAMNSPDLSTSVPHYKSANKI